MSYLTFREQVNINQNRFDERYASHFKGFSLFEKISLALCKAGVLSKKEYAESVEVLRILQRFIGRKREITLYDICGGHGLVSILLYALSDSIIKVCIIDQKKPDSYQKIMACIQSVFSKMSLNIDYIQDDYRLITYTESAMLLGIHACGIRTDDIINIAIKNSFPGAVLPCCYKQKCLPDNLKKFQDHYKLKDLVDFSRINRLQSCQFKVHLRTISQKVTPMNKLFVFYPEKTY